MPSKTTGRFFCTVLEPIGVNDMEWEANNKNWFLDQSQAEVRQLTIFLYQCYETYPSKIDPHVIASNSIMFIVDS